MSKWYEVTVTAFKTLVIEVDDSEGVEEANEIAMSEAFSFCQNLEADEARLIAPGNALDSAKRHADEVFPLEEVE